MVRIKVENGSVELDVLPGNWVFAVRKDEKGFFYEPKRRARGVKYIITGSDAIPDTICNADGRVYDRKSDLYAAIDSSGCRIMDRGESDALRKEAETRTGFEGVTEKRWNEILKNAKEKTEANTGERIDFD